MHAKGANGKPLDPLKAMRCVRGGGGRGYGGEGEGEGGNAHAVCCEGASR